MRAGGKKIVVVDTDVSYERNNRLFDISAARDNRFLWYWNYFYEQCRRRGIELITSDIYFSLENKPRGIPFLSVNMWSRDTARLMKAGLKPAVVFGYENPVYGCRFYFNLRKFTEYFGHAFVWRGARDKLSPRTEFHDAAYRPQAYPRTAIKPDFQKRKFLAMINRAARIHPLKKMYAKIMSRIRPYPGFDGRDLYGERIRAIKYFSASPDFALYGGGWDRVIAAGGELGGKIKKAYRGYVPDKLAALRNYKFSVCFENVAFGGLVSEKIIDSLFAGCIPVYLGAPDIADYIPENCFVDFRKFGGYGELNDYLRKVDEKTYGNYIDNINKFIVSPAYTPFTEEYFTEEMLRILQSYF